MAQPQDTADMTWFRREWWTRYFKDDLAPFWPALDALPSAPHGDNYVLINRNDVFEIADSDSEHRELHTAVAAYVWGVGKSVYQLGWLVRAFTHQPAAVEPTLKNAASLLFTDGAVTAYASMLPGGSNHLKFMGPAYFTKFLFFMGYRESCPGPRPLILDKRVATGLRTNGIMSIPDSGWPAATYERYLLHCQARDPEEPENIEIELFNAGRG